MPHLDPTVLESGTGHYSMNIDQAMATEKRYKSLLS